MARRFPPRSLPVDRALERPPARTRPDEQRLDGIQMASIPRPTPAARAKAQLNLAVMATERLHGQDTQQAWLADLMDALGLHETRWRALLRLPSPSTSDPQETSHV